MKIYPGLFEVIRTLVGGQLTGGDDLSEYIYHDGQTPPSQVQIDTKMASMLSNWEAEDYARNRKLEYDALNQFEMQFDDKENGTTTWDDAVNAIKAKYPKPE